MKWPLPDCDLKDSDAKTELFLKEVGLFLNHRRYDLGWSQEEVAAAAGLSRAEIHHIEHGTTNEGLRTLKRVCLALGVSLGEVVTHAEHLMEHPEHAGTDRQLKNQRGKNTRRKLQ
jgi:transcriptional regulator with XRE-family HTH domain